MHDVGSRRVHWTAWEKICRPKKEGGMGITDFENLNLALLAKMAWRLFTTPSSLISSVLFLRNGFTYCC